jgi:hypothetical protein
VQRQKPAVAIWAEEIAVVEILGAEIVVEATQAVATVEEGVANNGTMY